MSDVYSTTFYNRTILNKEKEVISIYQLAGVILNLKKIPGGVSTVPTE